MATVTQVVLAASVAAIIQWAAGAPPQVAVLVAVVAGALLPDLPLIVRPWSGSLLPRSREQASAVVIPLLVVAVVSALLVRAPALVQWVACILIAGALIPTIPHARRWRESMHHAAGLLLAPLLGLALWWQYDAWWAMWVAVGYMAHLASEPWVGLTGIIWRGRLYSAIGVHKQKPWLKSAVLAASLAAVAWSAVAVRLDADYRVAVDLRYPPAAYLGDMRASQLTAEKFRGPPWRDVAGSVVLLAAGAVTGMRAIGSRSIPLKDGASPQSAASSPPPRQGPVRPPPPGPSAPHRSMGEREHHVVPSGMRVLEEVTIDLVAEAAAGRLPPVVGRQDVYDTMVSVLLKAEQAAPVLLGDPGVGKTAVVHKLARLLAQKSDAVPPRLRGARLLELNRAALDAGTPLRGMFEERIQHLLANLERDPNTILFVDELHAVVGAGAAEMGAVVGAGQYLKPALARGTLRMIGATTTAEYRRHIEKDPALARRFTPVHVGEPSRRETHDILRGVADYLAGKHGVKITPAAVDRAVDWSIRYLPGRFLPDKAKRLLDGACARVGHAGRGTVEPDDIADVIARDTGIPVGDITADDAQRIRDLPARLGARVRGQDGAIETVHRALRAWRVGISDPGKPIGAFLFFGPTGVGKTELARALAQAMFGKEDALVRIDMTEYRQPADAARLTGAPPGYQGHEEGGQLTEKVRRRPHSVVLIDEIDKGYWEVQHIFMRVFDEGKLTDAAGVTVDFTNTVLIATSNLGAEAWRGADPEDARSVKAAAERASAQLQAALRPEFYNRLTPVPFYPLDRRAMRQIVDVRVKEILRRIAERYPGIHVDIPGVVCDWLAQRGYVPEMGARPLARVIENCLTDRISAVISAADRPAGRLSVTVSSTGDLGVRLG